MEEGIFTLWSIVHIFSGTTLAFLFSLRQIKLMEFAGVFAIPFLFIDNTALRIISLVIVFFSAAALVIKRSSKKKEPPLILSIIIILFLLILWEIFEYITSPITGFGKESTKNRISDVVFAFLSFSTTYIIIHIKRKRRKHHNNP